MKYNYFKKNILLTYAIVGILFGFLFPISAIIFELISLDLHINLKNIIYIHKHNNLLFMIDTAPLFLGSFSSIAGFIRSKLEVINNELEHQATVDELTNAYTRRHGNKLLNNFINSNTKIGIIFIDLDRFKMINDTLGHSIGDKLLQAVANRLMTNSKQSEYVIRLGGDEFMVIVENFHDIETLTYIASKLIQQFDKPFWISNRYLSIKASMGISIFPDHGKDIETLLKYADVAMYTCKNNKKSKFEIFNDSMLKNLDINFNIENELYNALERKEFFLVYQPIVDANTSEILAAEVLLRWDNHKLGLISPEKFIYIAESTNLIIDIGKWVLKEACIQNKLWQKKGYPPITMSVNVSVAQLKQANFINIVKEILAETELDTKYLKLEITESISIENPEEIYSVFQELKQLGIKLSIDDFGTGYSSLSELKNLMIDTLKIDKSFIRDINVNINKNSTLIVSAIISIAKNLNLNIIAEGVETVAQLQFLKNHNCNQIQGYLFSKPVKAEKFEELLKNNLPVF
ncbi:putative bifunctional diguanylate cyclase/phosphodiesterase [Clostridium sp. ZS2-4]|uniref:putative bifunctional diguanylate cyclase/phosphodiesterase n=1 Tax=Clostridium sp. ZS2-4 TaxID=2987703 RepID=UPI00227CBB82|nr:bifunctional diguanylate cyclase/phosphodiesterase [Clostridium sp. ZS2-4]MCY6355980.1 bifunctional diguanylate cyclase/phosphodiesterase [Clostridium sp. ZS2-4]